MVFVVPFYEKKLIDGYIQVSNESIENLQEGGCSLFLICNGEKDVYALQALFALIFHQVETDTSGRK